MPECPCGSMVFPRGVEAMKAELESEKTMLEKRLTEIEKELKHVEYDIALVEGETEHSVCSKCGKEFTYPLFGDEVVTDRVKETYGSLNESEKFGVKFGLFPYDKCKDLTKEETIEMMTLAGAQ